MTVIYPRPSWADLSTVIERLVDAGELVQINVHMVSPGHYEASARRPVSGGVFRVSVATTAVDAVLNVLGPVAGQSWEDRLQYDPEDWRSLV